MLFILIIVVMEEFFNKLIGLCIVVFILSVDEIDVRYVEF